MFDKLITPEYLCYLVASFIIIFLVYKSSNKDIVEGWGGWWRAARLRARAAAFRRRVLSLARARAMAAVRARVAAAAARQRATNRATAVAAAVAAAAAGNKYVGCYRDSGDRDMTRGPRRYGFTIDSCRNECKRTGFKYAGLQAGSYCFCDNTFGKHGKRPDSECPSGKGGGYINAVYNTTVTTPTPTPTHYGYLDGGTTPLDISLNYIWNNEIDYRYGYTKKCGGNNLGSRAGAPTDGLLSGKTNGWAPPRNQWGVSDPKECMKECGKDPECSGFTYRGGRCYWKKNITDSSMVDVPLVYPARPVSCSRKLTTAVSRPWYDRHEFPEHKLIYEWNPYPEHAHCGGNDLGNRSGAPLNGLVSGKPNGWTPPGGMDECKKECKQDPDCTAFIELNGKCYWKKDVTHNTIRSQVIGPLHRNGTYKCHWRPDTNYARRLMQCGSSLNSLPASNPRNIGKTIPPEQPYNVGPRVAGKLQRRNPNGNDPRNFARRRTLIDCENNNRQAEMRRACASRLQAQGYSTSRARNLCCGRRGQPPCASSR